MATLSVPIWNTELAEICAIEKTAEPTPTITPSAQANKRQEGLTTTTITTELTYTGVNCMTPGLVNCPNSAQKTERFVETKTVVTAVPSGVDFTLPASIQDRVVDTVAFGENAVTAPATTGSPVSYVPPPPPKTTDEHGNVVTTEDKDGDGKPDKKKKGGLGRNAIIGLSVGLGDWSRCVSSRMLIRNCEVLIAIAGSLSSIDSPTPRERQESPKLSLWLLNHMAKYMVPTRISPPSLTLASLRWTVVHPRSNSLDRQ
jgi:hypothetical protein